MNSAFSDIPYLIKKEKYLHNSPVYVGYENYSSLLKNENSLGELHQHQFIEISYVAAGSGIHRIWNKSYPVSAGDLFLLNTAVAHNFFTDSDGHHITVRSLYFDPLELFGPEITEIGGERYLFGLFSQNNFTIHLFLKPKQLRTITQKFDELLQETDEQLVDWKETIPAMLTMLLITIKRLADTYQSTQTYSDPNGTSLTSAVLHMIEENYSDPSFSLKNVSERLHISHSSLSRNFFEVTGKHFSSYLCSYRMQQAAMLAAETELSNIEIASMCGYCDTTSFQRQFRQVIGVTPGDFRKLQKQKSAVQAENETQTFKQSLYTEISDYLLQCRGNEVISLVASCLEQDLPAEEILNLGLVPGMNAIGEKFRANKVFVMEVLAAAKAMNSSMELLKPHLIEAGIEPIGKAVICSVSGDMHDIGKNLVKLMMEGEGITCIDLGVNVPSAAVVEAVREHNSQLVCLSSLMTTTMMGLRDVIDALKKSGLRSHVKVMVGGAPVTQAFADSIGADCYTPDAVTAAKEAKRLIQEMNKQ